MPLVRADELDTSPPEYLIEGLIPFIGTGFIWGESRWGKSLLTNGEMALAIANGTDFFGRDTVQGSVAVCLGEGLYDAGIRKTARLAREQSDRAAIAEQIDRNLGAGAGVDWLERQTPYTDDNLYYMTEPFVLPLDNGGTPTRTFTSALDSLRRIPNLSLVILDALSDFTPSLSISNDASANRIVQGMKLMARELDCVVLAVAHPTRDGGRMLGAGRLFNSSDFVIKIEPEHGASSTSPFRSATVSCEKNKYGKPFEPFGYEIVPCSWEDQDIDLDGHPTGTATLVQTATVRSLEDYDSEPAPRPKQPLPNLIIPKATDITPKRTGLRGR
jgi:hypothetical protein